jgi:hypothetical protein
LFTPIPPCYGIIFWENSINSRKVFFIHKKNIRIMEGTKNRTLAGNYLRSLIFFH